MIFPKSNQIYENLSTSFTNFDELLSNLKANQTTGYMQISFWDFEGVLFLDSGSIINGVKEIGNVRQVGNSAINSILKKAEEKDGTISVYSLSPEVVLMLAGSVQGEVKFKDLTSDFADPDKLVTKLINDKHTGYIEFLTNDHKGTAVIFLHNGDIIESFLSLEDKTFSKNETLSCIYETAADRGAVMNVYKSGLSVNGTEITTSANSSQLMELWNAIIDIIEKHYKEKSFDHTFRKILIDKADKYPFLDPFAGEFIIAKNKIDFKGILPSNFNQGLGEAIIAILQQMADLKINKQLELILKNHKDVIDKYELENLFNNILSSGNN